MWETFLWDALLWDISSEIPSRGMIFYRTPSSGMTSYRMTSLGCGCPTFDLPFLTNHLHSELI